MTPAVLFTKVRQHFGGEGADPAYSDDLLLEFLNQWIRDILTVDVKVGRTTGSASFSASSNPPTLDQFTAGLGSSVRRVLQVTWTPSGGSAVVLPRTSEGTLLALGKDPYRDRGTPDRYWIDHGVTTAITTAQVLIHIYPAPSAAGALSWQVEQPPADARLLDTTLTFPEIFAEAAEKYLVYRWQSHDHEDYPPAVTDHSLALYEAAYRKALGQWNLMAGPQAIRHRIVGG